MDLTWTPLYIRCTMEKLLWPRFHLLQISIVCVQPSLFGKHCILWGALSGKCWKSTIKGQSVGNSRRVCGYSIGNIWGVWESSQKIKHMQVGTYCMQVRPLAIDFSFNSNEYPTGEIAESLASLFPSIIPTSTSLTSLLPLTSLLQQSPFNAVCYITP